MKHSISSANLPAGGTHNEAFVVPAGTYLVRLDVVLTGDASASCYFLHAIPPVSVLVDIPNDDADHEIKTLGGQFNLSVEAGSGTAGLSTFRVFRVA